MTALLELGDYLVRVRCPHCDRPAEVPAVIERVLKVKGWEGSLTVSVSAKPVPHDCRQSTLDEQMVGVDVANGEIVGVSDA